MPCVGTLLVNFLRDDLLIIGSIGAGCAMLASCLEKRGRFPLRIAVSFLLIALWMIGTNLWEIVTSNYRMLGILRYSGVFVLFLFSVMFWCKATFRQALYAITVSYSIQNLCERIIEIPRYSVPNFPVVLDRLCLLLLMCAALTLYYRLFIADSNHRAMFDFSNLSSQVMLLLGVGVVGISVVLDIVIHGQTPRDNAVMRNCMNIMSATFSLLVVVLCMSHLRETDSEKRAEVTQQLLRGEQRRYEQEKLLHDAINIKCHDIRHQIAAMGESAYGTQLKEIGKLVDIYDASPRTQCAALDVVLAGKTLACASQGITLTCLGDGRRLGFMEDSDIFALFGNILDNAIEAAAKTNDPEKRLVSLTVRARDGLLLIEEENFFSGELTFAEGLPVTTKDDQLYHGFGTRSIRILTEKYGGDLKLQAKNGIFRLSILLPIPAEKTKCSNAPALSA